MDRNWKYAVAMALILAGLAPAREPLSLVLEDQFRQPRDLANLRGAVVVVVYADRDGADASRALGERLHLHFHPTAQGLSPAKAAQAPVRPIPDWPKGSAPPDVVTVPAAALGAVPRSLRGLVRSEFAKASPEMAVWLDWNDVLRSQFGLGGGVPNVLVIDGEGRLRHKGAGVPDDAQFARLTRLVEALRREARPR